MKKYYLYGAGINCNGVIHFFGRESIIAIIDADEKKWGQTIDGIKIISLREYIESGNGETIIITVFFERDDIADYLDKQGVHNYYKSPYMQTGFYENSKDIVKKLNLEKCSEIICCTSNPISNLIEEVLSKKSIAVKYIDRDKLTEVDSDTFILATNEEDNDEWKKLSNSKELQKICDINAIYREKFSYKNKNLMKFKDIHRGKRCFIIGNGPSLTYDDLECLHQHGEICFGVNRIYLSYEYTNWRPDYYVAVDYTIVQNDRFKIRGLPGPKFIRHFYVMPDEWGQEDIYEFGGISYPIGQPQLSFDISQGVYIGHTVVYDAMQIALYMGFHEIYLLGVDMTSGLHYQDEGAHFYKSPDTNENLGTGNTFEARRCIGYAAKVMEEEGKILKNATRGGELEEVSRIDFDSLF